MNSSWDGKKKYKVELKRKAAKDIWKDKEEIYNKASFSNTRSR